MRVSPALACVVRLVEDSQSASEVHNQPETLSDPLTIRADPPLLPQLLEQIKGLRDEVGQLRRELRTGSKRLLSYREAAKRLGIDRGETLHLLIKRGWLKVVKANGQDKISAEQVEQLARDGFDVGVTRRNKS